MHSSDIYLLISYGDFDTIVCCRECSEICHSVEECEENIYTKKKIESEFSKLIKVIFMFLFFLCDFLLVSRIYIYSLETKDRDIQIEWKWNELEENCDELFVGFWFDSVGVTLL